MSREKPTSQFNDQWLIRNESEQIKGPYSTDAVSKMILEGIFSGIEDISTYPDGDWLPLSKRPEFFEVLMESLENPVSRDERRAAKMDAETVIQKHSSELPVSQTPEDPPKSMADDFKDFLNKDPADVLPSLPEVGKPRGTSRSIAKSRVGNQNRSAARPPVNTGEALIKARDKRLTIELQQIKKMQNRELKKIIPFVSVIDSGRRLDHLLR
jgi:hypothetical protein